LIAVLTILLIWLLTKHLKKIRANRYRGEALQRLALLRLGVSEAGSNTEDMERLLRQIPFLIKSTALAAFPRSLVAGLYGDDWLNFLDQTIGSDDFRQGAGRHLPLLSFGSPALIKQLDAHEIERILKLTEHWIQNHYAVDVEGELEHV